MRKKFNASVNPLQGVGDGFLETICIQNGIPQSIPGHLERMQQAAAYFGFVAPDFPELERLMPTALCDEKVKCRIVYRAEITEITFEKYIPRLIKTFKLIEASPDYLFKFSDRSELSALLAQKGDCDEILITRNGCITDTSFSNVAFRKGNDFFTPDTYILNGTKRQLLLHEGIIRERKITVDDMAEFDEMILINAMLGLSHRLNNQPLEIDSITSEDNDLLSRRFRVC